MGRQTSLKFLVQQHLKTIFSSLLLQLFVDLFDGLSFASRFSVKSFFLIFCSIWNMFFDVLQFQF